MESLASAFENAFSAGCWAITFKIAAGFLVGKEIALLLQGNVANQGSRGGGKWRESEEGQGSQFYFLCTYNITRACEEWICFKYP